MFVPRGSMLNPLSSTRRAKLNPLPPLNFGHDQSGFDEIIRLAEEVCCGLTGAQGDSRHLVVHGEPVTRHSTTQLKQLLSLQGRGMERFHRDTLDKLETTLREASLDSNLDIITRLNVLEILEMRLEMWTDNPVTTTMYRQKCAEAQLDMDMKKIGYLGEFGVYEDSMSHFGEHGGGFSNPIKVDLEYTTVLTVNGQKVEISSSSQLLADSSKEVLSEFYSLSGNGDDKKRSSRPEICYARNELICIGRSPVCQDVPAEWDTVMKEIPFIVRRRREDKRRR